MSRIKTPDRTLSWRVPGNYKAPAEVAGLAVDAAGIIASVDVDAAHFIPRLEFRPGLEPPQPPEVLQRVAFPACSHSQPCS